MCVFVYVCVWPCVVVYGCVCVCWPLVVYTYVWCVHDCGCSRMFVHVCVGLCLCMYARVCLRMRVYGFVWLYMLGMLRLD